MTKQEQIEEMRRNIYYARSKVNGIATSNDIAEALYNAGYRKIDEFEKCRKCPAWSGIDCTRNPYTEGCLDDKVNLKNEIKRLEKENEQLKAKLKARLTCDFVKTAQTRKETAKEIFQKVVNICIKEEDFQDGTVNTQLEPLYFGIMNGCAFIRGEVKKLAEQYGVEVEE